MEPIFTFRNLDATESLKEHTRQKILKLNKYLQKPLTAHVILTVDRHEHRAEITLVDSGTQYVGAEGTRDMYASIDLATDKILRQLKKAKEKHQNHHRP